MQQSASSLDLDVLQSSIANLQRSSRRTLPMFIIGILATILAGAVALWYVLSLLDQLNDTRNQLRQTQQALVQARMALDGANSALRQTQATASAANAPRIAAAIKDVTQSEAQLTSAAQSLTKATVALPTTGATNSDSSLSGRWTDQYGTSYQVQHSGSSFSYKASFKNAAALGAAAHGTAKGTFDNGKLRYEYSDGAGNRYTCQSTVSTDFRRIDEECRTGRGKPLHVRLVRL